jgi:hypothetical protein
MIEELDGVLGEVIAERVDHAFLDGLVREAHLDGDQLGLLDARVERGLRLRAAGEANHAEGERSDRDGHENRDERRTLHAPEPNR